MKATTSPLGMLTDPPLVGLATAIGVLAALGANESGAGPMVVRVLSIIAALPISIALIVTITLTGARRKLVDWLASLPFPLDNMNAILNGLGDGLEVTLAKGCPEEEAFFERLSKELNQELDKVHSDSFVTKSEHEERLLEIRIGVVDSKRNPAKSNHERFVRTRALVEQVLVPLNERHAIESVRVK